MYTIVTYVKCKLLHVFVHSIKWINNLSHRFNLKTPYWLLCHSFRIINNCYHCLSIVFETARIRTIIERFSLFVFTKKNVPKLCVHRVKERESEIDDGMLLVSAAQYVCFCLPHCFLYMSLFSACKRNCSPISLSLSVSSSFSRSKRFLRVVFKCRLLDAVTK